MDSKKRSHYMHKVNRHASRKIRAHKQAHTHVWSGLGMIGVIGWSIAIPTLLGLAAGLWLDETFPGSYMWTLNLLLIGVCLGCAAAWHWVAKEYKTMNKHEEDDNGR